MVELRTINDFIEAIQRTFILRLAEHSKPHANEHVLHFISTKPVCITDNKEDYYRVVINIWKERDVWRANAEGEFFIASNLPDLYRDIYDFLKKRLVKLLRVNQSQEAMFKKFFSTIYNLMGQYKMWRIIEKERHEFSIIFTPLNLNFMDIYYVEKAATPPWMYEGPSIQIGFLFPGKGLGWLFDVVPSKQVAGKFYAVQRPEFAFCMDECSPLAVAHIFFKTEPKLAEEWNKVFADYLNKHYKEELAKIPHFRETVLKDIDKFGIEVVFEPRGSKLIAKIVKGGKVLDEKELFTPPDVYSVGLELGVRIEKLKGKLIREMPAVEEKKPSMDPIIEEIVRSLKETNLFNTLAVAPKWARLEHISGRVWVFIEHVGREIKYRINSPSEIVENSVPDDAPIDLIVRDINREAGNLAKLAIMEEERRKLPAGQTSLGMFFAFLLAILALPRRKK